MERKQSTKPQGVKAAKRAKVCVFVGGLVETLREVDVGDSVVEPGVVLQVQNIDKKANILHVVSWRKPGSKGPGGPRVDGILVVFNQHGEPNVARYSPQAFFVASGFRPNAHCETLCSLRVRSEESLRGTELGVLSPWVPFQIKHHGKENLRRALVVSDDIKGWISLVTPEGAPLVRLKPIKPRTTQGGFRGRVSRSSMELLGLARAGAFIELLRKLKAQRGCCSRRASANVVDNDGRNALMYASSMGHYRIVEQLVSKWTREYDINWRDDAHRTALHWAVTPAEGPRRGSTHHGPIAWLLIRQGCPKDAQDCWGRTPLMTAIINDNLPCCKSLLLSAASAHVKDKAAMTALDYALLAGNKQVVELLRFNFCNESGVPRTEAEMDEMMAEQVHSDDEDDDIEHLAAAAIAAAEQRKANRKSNHYKDRKSKKEKKDKKDKKDRYSRG